MSARLPIIALILSTPLLSGCVTTYADAKRDQMQGGPEKRVAVAQQNLNQAKAEQQNRQDEKLSLERDIERNEKRIAAQRQELKKADAALAEARAKNKLSEQEYARLKKEHEAISRELNAVDMGLKADSGKPPAAAGPEVAAKQARLDSLDRRKKELEEALRKALAS